MINVVIPMAGRGRRFFDAGYKAPKPMIDIGGKPMIQWVVENIKPSRPHRFIFICLAEHLAIYPALSPTLRSLCPNCEIISISEVTDGAACTVLHARELIDDSNPLMIANADQHIALPIDTYLSLLDDRDADGLIMTFWSNHPKWSYCKLNENSTVAEVVEKKVVSYDATVGIYNFRRGSDFVFAADSMISSDLRVNGEFYVAPTYNELIRIGRKIFCVNTGREYDGMFGLGTPTDLRFFLTTDEFRSGCANGHLCESQRVEIIAERAQLFGNFFAENNVAGLRACLAPDARYVDEQIQLNDRDAIVDQFRKVFACCSRIRFAPSCAKIDGHISTIPLLLQFNVDEYVATLTIQWNDSFRAQNVRSVLQRESAVR